MVSRKSRSKSVSIQKNVCFSTVFKCRGIVLLIRKTLFFFCLNHWYIISFSIFHPWFCNFWANEVVRMSFINACGPKEALSSLMQSLLKALVHSNLPLRQSWIANDVHSFCAMIMLKPFLRLSLCLRSLLTYGLLYLYFCVGVFQGRVGIITCKCY